MSESYFSKQIFPDCGRSSEITAYPEDLFVPYEHFPPPPALDEFPLPKPFTDAVMAEPFSGRSGPAQPPILSQRSHEDTQFLEKGPFSPAQAQPSLLMYSGSSSTLLSQRSHQESQFPVKGPFSSAQPTVLMEPGSSPPLLFQRSSAVEALGGSGPVAQDSVTAPFSPGSFLTESGSSPAIPSQQSSSLEPSISLGGSGPVAQDSVTSPFSPGSFLTESGSSPAIPSQQSSSLEPSISLGGSGSVAKDSQDSDKAPFFPAEPSLLAQQSSAVELSVSILNQDADYIISHYKVHPCPFNYMHDLAICDYVHPGYPKRRDPMKILYKSDWCYFIKNRGSCTKGEDCLFAHNFLEWGFHPDIYRKKMCRYGFDCNRRNCYYAHRREDLRD